MVLICGIDEARRGPLIGPMVITGVLVSEKEEKFLKKLDVKDSKLLSPKQRKELFPKIKFVIKKYKSIVMKPKEIDKAVLSDDSNLNWLEADKTCEIINFLKPDIVYIDCPSNNIKAYLDYVKDQLKNKKIKIIAEHNAERYTPVAAASIISKVIGDREIEKIKKKLKINFGSGYPSDPLTQKFLSKNYDKYPEIFRKSWATYTSIVSKKGQKKLGEF